MIKDLKSFRYTDREKREINEENEIDKEDKVREVEEIIGQVAYDERKKRKQIIAAEEGEWFRPMPKKSDYGHGVRVIPTLSWMRYQYTCQKCKCHVVSTPGISDAIEGWELVVCGNCGYAWKVP